MLVTPLKWRKYGLLRAFGLVSAKEIESIHRFSADDVDGAKEVAESLAIGSERESRGTLFVVKAVAAERGGQLPNFRLWKVADIPALSVFLSRYSMECAEFWICGTEFSEARPPVAGRILFDRASHSGGQVVECVWNASPRLLESIAKDPTVSFARAARLDWGWPIRLDSLRCGREEARNPGELRRDFAEVVRRLEERREALLRFAVWIEGSGINVYSFEFKVVRSGLEIIDWDTTDDARVLSVRHLSVLSGG